MCRINGLLSKNVDKDLICRMRDSMSYGGPDDQGVYVNEKENVGLGQRRLSILDLTISGHQPMRFKDLVLVYNGEIYNFKEISLELKLLGYDFVSESDSEVILKAFDCWSYEAVKKFRGMFSFAIWNETTEKLLLCRDRVGVKPLYWYLKDHIFMFASELKAFHEHPEFDKDINHNAVSLFLQTGYIRSPLSIYSFANKLDPGSFLEIDSDFKFKIWKYWDVQEIYMKSKLLGDSENVLIEECESLLTESFKLRMVSDVPVGMFLSGGIDSSLVTALLQKESQSPLKTFTIGFEDKKYNESHFAKKIAKHIGTEHHELICKEEHFKETINYLPEFYDEPFGDSSAIPTYLVSKLAKTKVTVSLSADGGDEIFAGYNRYLFADNLYSKISKIPKNVRLLASDYIGNLNSKRVEKVINFLPLPEYYKKNIDARLPKLSEALKSKTALDFLYSSTLFLTKKNLNLLHNFESNEAIFNKNLLIGSEQKYGAFGVADIQSYLEGDILTKVDRATMQNALEGRDPFLDHKIIEFAFSLPDKYKIRNGETKWILRQILFKYVPRELIERPKMGFGIPLDSWLSSFLVDDLQEMLDNNDFFELFKLNKIYIRHTVELFLSKKGQSSYLVWYLLCLFKWYQKWC